MMKAGYFLKNDLSFDQPVAYVVPTDTSHQHLQRVEEWTQNSNNAPPPNMRRSVKDKENQDLEAKSFLIAEAVQLLDNRDKQTRSRPTTAENDMEQQQDNTNDADSDAKSTEGAQYYAIGKHFRNSKLSARNYVKHFEMKMQRKKVREDTLSNTYPLMRSKKKLPKMNQMFDQKSDVSGAAPDSSIFKTSRSVKFTIKSGSQNDVAQKPPEDSEEGEDKWAMKEENDRDWWKWKLKQRFLQNDELLHKLATQRQKLEQTTMLQGENNRFNRNPVFNNKRGLSTTPDNKKISIPAFTSAQNNSSWHVSVEIPSHMTPSVAGSKILPSSTKKTTTQQVVAKARDPIPNFYTPSKQLVSAITHPTPSKESLHTDADLSAKQKLKVLRKDPYLSKLLAGNEMFRPEMMLGDKQQNRKHEVPQNVKTSGNARRKLSLESLSDTEDELVASKFFDPDVKVLYERLSEMEMLNNDTYPGGKSKLLAGPYSREPSDGFLNLPILLETGRFNGYNKLPSMKLLTASNNNKYSTLKQQPKGFEKNDKLQTALNKMKKSTNLTNVKLVNTVLTGGVKIAEPNTVKINEIEKIENLPTNEWAKKLITKVRKQDAGTKTDDNGQGTSLKEDGRNREMNDIFNIQPRRYKVPEDQETNLLYHEILMSKWKKEKHNENISGRHNKYNTGKWGIRGDQGLGTKIMDEDLKRPRGLDIWLENIREKAKRDRVISPLPNNADILKGVTPYEK